MQRHRRRHHAGPVYLGKSEDGYRDLDLVLATLCQHAETQCVVPALEVD